MPDTIMSQLSTPAVDLLKLLVVLGGDKIPKLLFKRVWTPQQRWKEDGESVTVSFDVSSSNRLHEFFKPGRLDDLIKELVSSSWICIDYCDKGFELSYSIPQIPREQLIKQLGADSHRFWTLLAVELVCFVFPRDSILDERLVDNVMHTSLSPRSISCSLLMIGKTNSFQKDGRVLAALVDRISKQSKTCTLATPMKLELAEVLVAQAGLGFTPYHQKSLDDAIELLGDQVPHYILSAVHLRQSVIARLQGDFSRSETIIASKGWAGHHKATSARGRALNRSILVSHLENLIQLERYEQALTEIDDPSNWEPSDSAKQSLMERSVNVHMCSVVAKVYQSFGQLEKAISYLECCYSLLAQKTGAGADPNRFQMICRLADLLCAQGSWSLARLKIQLEIDAIMGYKPGKLARALRRLRISLVDVDIAEGKYDKASADIHSLKDELEKITSSDIGHRWMHVRLLVASARILLQQQRYSEAVEEWQRVLTQMDLCPGMFSRHWFFFGLCQLSIFLARTKADPYSSMGTEYLTSDVLEEWKAASRQVFDEGCDLLAQEDVNYWIPTLPNAFVPDFLHSIELADPDLTAGSDTFRAVQRKYPRRGSSRI